MKIVAVKHVASEGPGRFGDFFSFRGDEIRTVRLYAGDALPEETAGIDLIISLGGPMNVYEDEAHPFLPREIAFLQRAMAGRVPVLGICLGAQLIARAAGAKVYRSPVKETGWLDVTLTAAAARDPLFAGLPEKLPVLQWHEDTFDVPAGGTLLAEGSLCPHQAFRTGSAWGLQFHLEARRDMVAAWFDGHREYAAILDRTDALAEQVERACHRFCQNLAALAAAGPAECKGLKT